MPPVDQRPPKRGGGGVGDWLVYTTTHNLPLIMTLMCKNMSLQLTSYHGYLPLLEISWLRHCVHIITEFNSLTFIDYNLIIGQIHQIFYFIFYFLIETIGPMKISLELHLDYNNNNNGHL